MPKIKAAPAAASQLEPKALPAPVAVTSARLDALLDDRLTVAAKIDQLTARKKALDEDILAITRKKSGAENGAVDTGEFMVRAVSAENSHIDRAELLRLGVRATIIEAATKKTPYSYPRITRKKAADLDALEA